VTTADIRKIGQDGMSAALGSLSAWSQGAQAIAVEFVDYSKKSADGAAAAWDKLMGATSLEQAMQVQTEYLTSWYQGLVVETAKLGKLYVDLAEEAVRPIEHATGKVTTAS
jgi:hypothetical protein